MRIFWIFGVLVGFIGAWIAFFKPFNVQKTPQLQTEATFKDFRYYELTPQKIDIFIEGSMAMKSAHALTIRDFHMLYNRDSLIAKRGVYAQNAIHLYQDILYRHDDEYNLTTQRAWYDNTKEILFITKPFTIRSKGLIAKGQKGVLYRKLGTMRAQRVQASIEEE